MAMDPVKVANIMAGAAVKKSRLSKPALDADGEVDAGKGASPMPGKKSAKQAAAIAAKKKAKGL